MPERDGGQQPAGAPADVMLLVSNSFVSGLGAHADPQALAGLRAGTPLRLRRRLWARHSPRHEVLTAEGRPLGWLPQEDADWLESLGLSPEAAMVEITALVPAFQRPRILIRLAIAAEGGGLRDVAA